MSRSAMGHRRWWADSSEPTRLPGQCRVRLPESRTRTPRTHGPDQPGPVGSILVQRAVSFGRAHAAILGVLAVVALVFTGSRVMAARGHDVEPVAVTPVATTPATPTASQSSTAPKPIQVHVLGAVQAPGVVSVPSGARVAQAIEAAGGLRPEADPAELNLAAVVADGAQIIIGTTAQPRGEIRVDAGSSGGSIAGPAAGGAPTLNLNTATVQQLESLPGIGPVTAARIIAWREANGGFTRVEELQEVDGIGPKTYASLAPLVHV